MTKSIAYLQEIKESITQRISDIYQRIEPCMTEEQRQIVPECYEDIKKIHEGTRLLSDQLNKLLDEKQIDQHQQLDLPQYLSTVRHALRNPINVIQGYSEIVLEELKHLKPFKYTNNIIEIISLCYKILALIDNIKTESVGLSATPESAESNIPESDEYQDFKKSFSILIVDDEIENCRILERNLSRFGFKNIQAVTDGFQALALKNKFDLILLDIQMPGMSGIDVLMKLKEDINQRKLMVLMISATDTMEFIIKCLTLGAEDTIQKPFKPELLHVRIRSCVQKKLAIHLQNVYNEKIEFEKARYSKLLHSVFPPTIVDQLSNTETVRAAQYNNIAIVFADVVGFTPYCDSHPPELVIQHLQELAALTENIAIKNNVQKIKTIGDAFLGVSGMLSTSANPVLDCINFAQALLQGLNHLASHWQLRIGINYGNVIGGIVGHRQYLFDIWGDAVNTASRIQAVAQPNTIYLSKLAWEKVADTCEGSSLGETALKGKTPLEIFMYKGKK